MVKCDFGGWATKYKTRCTDGRTINQDAFKHCDGLTVPMVWNHQHDSVYNVLGHAVLEHRDEGVYAYCTFNESDSGQQAKFLVKHGDVDRLSIYANQLQEVGDKRNRDVIHGTIREVSLVLASANPGAYIENVMIHSDSAEEEYIIKEDEAVICSGEYIDDEEPIQHAEESTSKKEEPAVAEEKKQDEQSGDKTVEEIFNSMTEEQKTVVYAMIGQALEDAGVEDDEDEEETVEHSEGGNDTMKKNVFDQEEQTGGVLTHSDMQDILADAKRCGSLREAFLAHADESGDNSLTEWAEKTQTYGINGTDFLFPDAHNLNPTPEFIKRDTGWVAEVMNGTHHTPFSRIKSMFADITEEDARAKGYIKGKLKKEEVFTLLKRTTTPTTIYKKQKMDRDDAMDITGLDVIAWLKAEMRMMLDEEIARAILVGDGRLGSSDDKINETNIRPIWKDEDLYTVKTKITAPANATSEDKAKAFIKGVIKSRKNYKGSGEPTLYTTEDMLTDCLLIEDSTGRIIYESAAKLASTLRVKKIVTVPVMEGLTRTDDEGKELELMGLIVNLKDYNVGADKGGAVNMFDDFDIDYNQQKYLIETRCSGALIKPYSAMAVEFQVEA